MVAAREEQVVQRAAVARSVADHSSAAAGVFDAEERVRRRDLEPHTSTVASARISGSPAQNAGLRKLAM